MSIEYVEYDNAGRLREKIESLPGEAPVTHEYAYDHRGWLTDEHPNGTLVAHFEYDANGNRTAMALGAGAPARTGVYDDQDRLTVAALVAAGVFILTVGSIMDNDAEVSTLQALSLAAAIAGMKCLVPGPKLMAPPAMRGCFTGDTEVVTSEGSVAISEVSAGDEVLSFDPMSGDWAWRTVSEAFVHSHEGRVYELGIRDEKIEVTGNHPVCVASGQALAARPIDVAVEPEDLRYPYSQVNVEQPLLRRLASMSIDLVITTYIRSNWREEILGELPKTDG